MTSREVAASAVAAAWNDAGARPLFHANAKRELFRNWPTLAHAVARLSQTPAGSSSRGLANRCLEIIEQACATAEDQESGNDHEAAARTLAAMAEDLIALLAQYAGPADREGVLTVHPEVLADPATFDQWQDAGGGWEVMVRAADRFGTIHVRRAR